MEQSSRIISIITVTLLSLLLLHHMVICCISSSPCCSTANQFKLEYLRICGSAIFGCKDTSFLGRSIFSVPDAVSGTLKILMLPVEFSDFSNTTEIKSNVVNEKVSPLVSYYCEVSYGSLTLNVSHFTSWFTLPHTRAYYGGDNESIIDVNLGYFIQDSLDVADPVVDYHDYDYVMLVHAGNDQAMSGDPNDIWSCASIGKWHFSNDGGVELGIAIVAETDPFGVYAHEFGHNLGLPDLYDVDYEEEFVGCWSLMGAGSWLDPPASIMAVEKMWLGWIPDINVSFVRTGQIFNVTVSSLETSGRILAVKIPLDSTYYIVEYRRKILTDKALPMEGVIISYVNESLGSGHGIVRIKDANAHTESLKDAAFTSGMRFIDWENEVAVKVWYLTSENASIMVQKGFADLVVQEIELIGDSVEGEEMYFDVHIRNNGVTPSNLAIISLSIDGIKLQEKGLSAVAPSSTSVLRFGPWHARGGVHEVIVDVDVNDDVVERNETNNLMSLTFNVPERCVVIDKASVSDKRADVNSTQLVFFHAMWSNGSDVVEGIIYVNGSVYVTNSTGWITLIVTSSFVGETCWHVTGVNANGVSFYRQEAPDPRIIWDALEVYDEGVSKERCDLGSIQTVWVKIRYAYDGKIFDDSAGSVWIGGKVATWDEERDCWYINDSRIIVGRNDYAIPSSFTDELYGLTGLLGRKVKSVIWDRVLLTLSVEDDRINVGSTALINVYGKYEYDSTPWNGYFVLNDTLTKTKVGKYSYTVLSITDIKYGLTVFESNVVSVVFDRISITLSVLDDRINIGETAYISVHGTYEYDGSAWHGTYTLNDTLVKTDVGKFWYEVFSVTDVEYGITVFESNSVCVIFDRVLITMSVSHERIDVGSEAEISVSGKYEYDSASWVGSYTFNDTLRKSTVGKYGFKIVSITDPKYNITVFKCNSVYVIWDRVIITLTSTYERVNVASEAQIFWKGKYEYDGKEFPGNVTLNEELKKFSVSIVSYKVVDISDPLYNLTAFTSNTVKVLFDKLHYEVKSYTMTPGIVKLEIRLSYQFDGAPITDASVTIGGKEAHNLGNGRYIVELSEWGPYVSYNIRIEKAPFTTDFYASFVAIGNSIMISLMAVLILIVTIVFFKRRRKNM